MKRPTDQDLQRRLKAIAYERIHQENLTALRVLYGERHKRIAHLSVLDAQAKTAALQLEKIRIGLALQAQGQVDLALDPIDLAQAEEKLARIGGERRETELEISNLETRMLGLVGAARVKP